MQVGDKVTLNVRLAFLFFILAADLAAQNIQGYLQTRIVFFLMNIHNRFRLIYFARVGSHPKLDRFALTYRSLPTVRSVSHRALV